MNLKSRARGSGPGYLAPYVRVVETAGPCFEALLWRSRETQTERFRVIAETTELTGRVIADLGCGRADLPAWLAAQGIEHGRYFGLDAVAEMVEFSRERAGREALVDCEFLAADFVTDETLFERLAGECGVECFVFSGSLNTMDQELAESVLARAWRTAARTGGELVFNFLSDRDGGPAAADDNEGPARRFSTLRMVRWALDRSSRVVLRHDYLQGQDATIGMRP